MNRAAFFAAVRSAPFTGSLTQPQVDGMNAILDEWERRQPASINDSDRPWMDIRWLAYMLATTFHETARMMQPIREFGRGKGMRYGTIYYGRGFVQLTWEANYRKASAVVSVDLVAHPDRALDLPVAATIMFDGMIRGWFTDRKLADYIDEDKCDYIQARRIINGTDKAVTIAGYAVSFEKALKAAAEPQPQVSDQPTMPMDPPTAEPPPLIPHPPDDPGVEPSETEQPAPSAGIFLAAIAMAGLVVLAIAKLFHLI